MDDAELEARVRAFLRDQLELPEADLGRDDPLVSTGLIDSADLVQLATHLERALGIEIPDRDIHADHFDSIARILAYAATRRRD